MMQDAHRPPARCFQGVVPGAIATCSADGVPNVTYLSQVYAIDDQHVALSCQFFNKTKANVLENPYAQVQLYDPVTFDAYQLDLRYERSETAGPLFDTMAARIQAIASHTGMAGVFRLLSADIYEVLGCLRVEGFLLPAPVSADADVPCEPQRTPGPRSELRALQRISQVTCGARELDELLTETLQALSEEFGFEHAMVLLSDPGQRACGAPTLTLAAAHGYGHVPPGTRVSAGEGLLGTVAERRRLLRFSGLPAELRYGRAVRGRTEHTAGRAALTPELPLPGLPDSQSHLAIPLLAAGRLVGVLAVESREPVAFDEWDEAFLEIVANLVAVALDHALLRALQEPTAEALPPAPEAAEPPVAPGAGTGREPGGVLRIRFFPQDDCVMADGEYLIRNVPGRILYKLLRAYADTGRTEFSNRELRLDRSLGLPAGRDNLESRLVLLRKRLEQRCPSLAIVSTRRGHFRLDVRTPLELSEAETQPAEPV